MCVCDISHAYAKAADAGVREYVFVHSMTSVLLLYHVLREVAFNLYKRVLSCTWIVCKSLKLG